MKISRTLVLGLFCFIPLMGLGQGMRPGGPQHFERLEQLRKVRLIEFLDLKEDQSVRFFARLNEHDQEKKALMDEKNETLDRIERLIRNRGKEEEFRKLFSDVGSVDQRISEMQRSFFDGLSDILTVEQQAKLLLFERHFTKELREAMMEIQRRRVGPMDR
jgi:dGTP triphosphohydrolase